MTIKTLDELKLFLYSNYDRLSLEQLRILLDRTLDIKVFSKPDTYHEFMDMFEKTLSANRKFLAHTDSAVELFYQLCTGESAQIDEV